MTRVKSLNKQTALRSALISSVLPWLLFMALRPELRTDTEALVAAGCVPVAWVLGRLIVTRKVEWLALVSIAVFAAAVAVSILSGGSSLPLKLRYSVVTGLAGLVFLGSLLARRPLLVSLISRRAGSDLGGSSALQEGGLGRLIRRRLTIATGLIGITLLADAAVRAVLAVSLPTSAFLVASSAASWTIIAAGMLPTLIYLRRGLRHAVAARQEPSSGQPAHAHQAVSPGSTGRLDSRPAGSTSLCGPTGCDSDTGRSTGLPSCGRALRSN